MRTNKGADPEKDAHGSWSILESTSNAFACRPSYSQSLCFLRFPVLYAIWPSLANNTLCALPPSSWHHMQILGASTRGSNFKLQNRTMLYLVLFNTEMNSLSYSNGGFEPIANRVFFLLHSTIVALGSTFRRHTSAQCFFPICCFHESALFDWNPSPQYRHSQISAWVS